MKRSPDYLAYMLRMWRENSKQAWRATLQNPHTGERYTFASLPALLLFLESQTGQSWLIQERDSPAGGERLES